MSTCLFFGRQQNTLLQYYHSAFGLVHTTLWTPTTVLQLLIITHWAGWLAGLNHARFDLMVWNMHFAQPVVDCQLSEKLTKRHQLLAVGDECKIIGQAPGDTMHDVLDFTFKMQRIQDRLKRERDKQHFTGLAKDSVLNCKAHVVLWE